MKIRDQIPQEFYENNKDLNSFVTVLDGMNAFKEYEVNRHSLFYKSLLIGDTSWLKKRLEDYGFPTIPEALPKQCMDALLINARNVMALKGSDLGLKYFLWCLTFGNIEIDWTNFYPKVNNLTLSEFTGKGYLLAQNPEEVDNVNYLLTSDTDLGGQVLRVTITSIYWDNPAVIGYIRDNIAKFINFTEDNFQFDLVMTAGPYHFIPEPFWYFTNPIDYTAVNIASGYGIGKMTIGKTFIVT